MNEVPSPRAVALDILPLRLEGVGYAAGGERLLRDIDLVFARGPRSVVLGPNGAGKSLLLRLCHGLLRPTEGRIVWNRGGHNDEFLRRHQAMVFQRPVLLRRSVAANVGYVLALRHTARAERARRTGEALERVGLAPLAARPARVLSGGEQQRLALARAWALRPQVLFLDEPTASLDPAATRAVEEIIHQFQRTGTKIIMTTHDLGQARRLADEIVFLLDGRLIEHAPAATFFRAPVTAAARAFLAGELPW